MKMQKILLTLTLITLASCAAPGPKLGTGMGMNQHKPNLDNTLVINKRDGVFRISTINGDSPAVEKLLNGNLLNCNSTTFSMPRSHTVGSFIREVFENELSTAKKYSTNGTGINVLVKSLTEDTSKLNNGTWTVVIDYSENDKSMNVETVTTYQSKVSILSSCTNTANVFEESLADNFVEYMKRKSKE